MSIYGDGHLIIANTSSSSLSNNNGWFSDDFLFSNSPILKILFGFVLVKEDTRRETNLLKCFHSR